MIERIELKQGEYGRRAIVKTAWSPEITDYLLDNHIVELELNDGKGWRGNDVLFLTSLPSLRLLNLLDLKLGSIEPIHFLHDLREMELMTYCQTEIRFSAFPHLTKCSLEWRPKAISLFECATLNQLFVNRYSGKNADLFARLTGLESLAILNAPMENLHGLSSLRNLKALRLGNLRRLSSLAGIENLGNLQSLEVHSCPNISSIKEVSGLSQLKELHLNNDGKIESLGPLRELSSLESVTFYESTNIIDGDISPLVCQKNLNRVSFRNRRHYSHRREEFGSAYMG